MKKDGTILESQPGIFCLSDPENGLEVVPETPVAVENPRGEAENTETINKMLNLYDKLLDSVADSIEKEDWNSITKKIEAIKSLRWLGATVDQLMKRWYLVHRGYDSNTKQAHEDAIQKTAERQKEAHANAPPEDRVVEVGHFHPDMQELWDVLPDAKKKQGTVPSEK